MTARAVAVFGSSRTIPGTQEWDDAETAGRSLADAGYAVVTGGYGGSMEAVSLGAASAGGHVVGVTLPSMFPDRSGANPYVLELIEAPSLTARIGVMLDRAIGSLALPGSIGTATELLVTWNANNIISHRAGTPFPSVAVGSGWRAVGQALADSIGASLDEIIWAETVPEGVEDLLAALENRTHG